MKPTESRNCCERLRCSAISTTSRKTTLDTAQCSDVRAADAQARKTGRTRLDRARQACGHDLDPCRRGGETPVPSKTRGSRGHARPACFGRIADRARRSDKDRLFRHRGPQGRSEERRVGKVTGVQTCALPICKRERRDVHGWIVLDKPVGMTSTHAVGVVKHLFQAKRAGHAGTLDPLASGVLPIALGEATKTVSFVIEGRKADRKSVV